MKASIIIRCKDEAAHIGQVLDGVFSQEGGIPFEVLVIDSGSTDSTLHIVSRYDCDVTCIPPEEFGYGYTMNLGAKKAAGDILVFLSAHCPPVNNGWLKTLLAPFDDPSVAGTFGRQTPVKGLNPFDEWRLARAFPEKGGRLQEHMFSSANAAVRKSVWEALPFDESLPFSEDRLWAREAAKFGHRITYVPKASVRHGHAFSLPGVYRRAYAAGWAKKKIYGDICRFDSRAWIAGAYLYCIIADALHFIDGGHWNFLKYIGYYRRLELSGFYDGARDSGKGIYRPRVERRK